MHPLRPAIGLLRNLAPGAHRPPGLNRLPAAVGMPDFQGVLDSFSALLNMLSSPLQQAFGAPLRNQKVETEQETSTPVAVDLSKPEGPEEVVQEEVTEDEPLEGTDEREAKLLPLALEGLPIQEPSTAPVVVEDPGRQVVDVTADPRVPQHIQNVATAEPEDSTPDPARVQQSPQIQNLTEPTTEESENARVFTPHDTSVTALTGKRPAPPVEEPANSNSMPPAPLPPDGAEDSVSAHPSNTTTTLEQLEKLLGTRVEADPEPVEDLATEPAQTWRASPLDVFSRAPEVSVVQTLQVEPAQSSAKTEGTPRAEAVSGPRHDRPESVSRTREVRQSQQSRQLDFIDRIVRAARLSRGHSVSRLKLTLDPPNLGSLKADLSVKDGVLKASLEAPSAAVRDMILANVSDLRQALEQAGIQVGDLQVSVREHGQHGARQEGRDGPDGFADPFDRPGVLTQQGTERIPLRPLVYQMLDVVA